MGATSWAWGPRFLLQTGLCQPFWGVFRTLRKGDSILSLSSMVISQILQKIALGSLLLPGLPTGSF